MLQCIPDENALRLRLINFKYVLLYLTHSLINKIKLNALCQGQILTL